MVVGSNLGGLKFNSFFAKQLVWAEYERVETTLAEGEGKRVLEAVF